MNKNGFTLIELLAVIIIIAVIASITVVSVNKTLKNSKNSLSDVQVDNIIKASKSYYLEEGMDQNVSCVNVSDLIGNNYIETKKVIDPKTRKPMEGSVSISYVDGKALYGYNDDKCKEIFKPQYYWYDLATGNIGDSLPSNTSTTPPAGKQIYLGFNVENNKISEAYACSVRNGVEYCVEGNNPEAYITNIETLKEVFSDVIDTDCFFDDFLSGCELLSDAVNIDSEGNVNVDSYDNKLRCMVDALGGFECLEY